MTHCLKFKIQVFSVLGRLWFKCKKLKQKMWLLKLGLVTLCLLAAVTRCRDFEDDVHGEKQTGNSLTSDETQADDANILAKFFNGLLTWLFNPKVLNIEEDNSNDKESEAQENNIKGLNAEEPRPTANTTADQNKIATDSAKRSVQSNYRNPALIDDEAQSGANANTILDQNKTATDSAKKSGQSNHSNPALVDDEAHGGSNATVKKEDLLLRRSFYLPSVHYSNVKK